MTAQIDDVFRIHDAEYAVAGISDGELFDPAVLGLEPSMACTACWRGFQVAYALLDARLVVGDQMPADDEIHEIVERAFDRSYRRG